MDVTSSLSFDDEPKSRVHSGYYCDIYQGQLRDGATVAIKTVKPYDYETNAYWRKRIRDVLSIWTRCHHVNVVEIFGEVQFQGCLTAVYEWHEHEGLRQYLDHHQVVDRYHLSAQICEGVTYLHANDIVHGALSGRQILVSNDGIPRILLSVQTTTTVADALGDHGRTRWTAPELLELGSKHTPASDVYALGMTILETIARSLPYPEVVEAGEFEEEEMMDILSSGELPQRPEDSIPDNEAGEEIWDVLCECWSHDPADRPLAEDVAHVMNSVYQTPDGVALKPAALLANGQDTSVKDLVSHFGRGMGVASRSADRDES